jgi:uncharacterized membrane protein YeaQ/YmgE (transglycosylase-associated protein family)
MFIVFAEMASENVRDTLTIIADVIAWLIVGGLAGSLAGMLIKGRKEGFGYLMNLGIGLIGALIGGLLFKLFRIDLGLIAQIAISLQEIVAGVLGALLFLAILWGIQKYWAKKEIAK